MKVVERFGCLNAYNSAMVFIAGAECEVESVKDFQGCDKYFFSSKEDHSLRNHGVEFVSVPLEKKDLIKNFKGLHTEILKIGNDAFSPRTSTHIHVNVSSMDEEQARTMVLLYALFEEFFFMIPKGNRRENIHCVPLTETYLPSIYKHDLATYQVKWSKYTALNLTRLKDLGTFEFRHLHGTNDVEEFTTWVSLLERLWRLAQTVRLDTLNETVIFEWFHYLFKDIPSIYQLRPTLFDIIRNNLIDVKLSI